ncbi:hypothetical protein [Staphylococcus epidermidis]|uniref:hypothetical protein n=2 Tax=Staphylococcus TaxID=1279 RepID=UPI0011A6FECA|nr:hypothetical protein [Staphylococcus epidermidis]MBM0811424.1 hypothetical protein [Staphylococcus epidermidis]MCG1589725.1 hypothetical protein [Staphylococcus epidermidis]MCG2103356.1 hypothetical protein [Staphylococcus epidermidis]MCG2213994.1 hypothetical protein [Staphylococcus epidermidis]
MKKITKSAILLFLTTIFLASCSSGGKDSKETNNEKIKMGNILNSKNEHISYILHDYNPIEKDTTIDFYILSKDGKAKVYDGTGDTTLGDISKMDNKDIKNRMIKEDKEWFEKDKKETLERLKEGEDKVSEISKGYTGDKDDTQEKKAYKYTKDFIDEHGNLPKKGINKIENIKYKDPKFQDIKLSIETDGSGNQSKSQEFKFKAHGFRLNSIDMPEDKDSQEYYFTDSSVTNTVSFVNNLSLTKEYEDTVAVTDIYEKKYAGLSSIDEDDEDKVNYFITEVGDKAEEVELDSPKDKYIDSVDGDKK